MKICGRAECNTKVGEKINVTEKQNLSVYRIMNIKSYKNN